MDTREREKKTQKRSSSTQKPSHSSHSRGAPAPVYHAEIASTRSVSTKARASSHSDRPQHPSLSRVKGRSNMYTPPRNETERSWPRDQSPVKGGFRTPPQRYRTPDSGTPTLINPTSTLLQGLLKEERAHRGSRGTASEDGVESPRTPDRSRVQEDTASEKTRKVTQIAVAAQTQLKDMGVREMDQYVSKMTKLNFDLKLEIFHRTQQMSALEKKLERMHEMQEELSRLQRVEEEVVELRAVNKRNQGLQETNSQLRQELDTKDKAVEEAVQWICKLETEIENLKTNGRASPLSINRLVLDGPNAQSQITIDIPERTSSKRAQSSFKHPEFRRLSKAPSFLRDDNQSTATLRSLYVPENNKSYSGLSQLTKSESYHTMTDAMEPGSPRLSVLSECSELHPYETPTKWNDHDALDIPIRKASSVSGSVESYATQTEQEESKEDQIDRWMQDREENSQTIIRRRQIRAASDASKASVPTFTADFTAYVTANNGSNGSVSTHRSPKEGEVWFAGRPLERRRSADEITSRRSFNGSDITDSMQTNCSDTPRVSMSKMESPTFFPFNTVASKMPNPVIDAFDDPFLQTTRDESPSLPSPTRSPAKTVISDAQTIASISDSPPLTPQDWIAAAKQGPRSRKERDRGLRIEPRPAEPNNLVISQAAFHDNDSVESYQIEPEVADVPTLDLENLDVLEQPAIEIPPRQVTSPGPEHRRRLSFRPPFFNRSANAARRLQSSPVPPEFVDDEDDGAPSPIIPKTRTMGGANRRPVSQIITNTNDFYSSSLPTGESFSSSYGGPKALHQSFMEAREAALPAQSSSTTVRAPERPTTSHSSEHKRRSSLGIFGWMKGVSGKRSEPSTPVVAEKFSEAEQKENRAASRLGQDNGLVDRCETPDSMEPPPVRPHSEMTMRSDDTSRRPRYVGRRSRRVN
ncbi:hypothetical protein N7493_009982 [Penicillium malachiteum]|uniref:Centrosomin N-terminal motif 1 domain-containing protein n=1 Tax=Penicillium malachiteum TaxID=1324776 RepID=A0AAD6HDU5_9EURO|nr:hypothetical protein N7493_009982 [Penicillium malachiteum]